MILAFLEDGTLAIHSTIDEVRREYERIGVESRVVRFYDTSGTYLAPIFRTPNRTQRHFLLFETLTSGQYDLRPAPDANEVLLWVCLVETSHLEPNPYFASLTEVKAHFSHCFPESNDEEQK